MLGVFEPAQTADHRPRRPERARASASARMRIGTGVRSATKRERLRAQLLPGPEAAAPGDSAKPRARQRGQIGRSLDMNPEKPCFRQGRMRRGIKLLSPHPELASLLELLLELEDHRIAQPIRTQPAFLEGKFQRRCSTMFFHIVGLVPRRHRL
jgi:hypothetical protein